MKGTSNSLIPSLFIALIANVLIFYFIFSQIAGVNAISDEWKSVKNQSFETAIHLAEVERGFGYVGFIHHFKNFIIRRTDTYYTRAIESHSEVSSALTVFKQQTSLSAKEMEYIQTIEETLTEYATKLAVANGYSADLHAKELDSVVKVDDSPAEHALNQLRAEILPRLQKEKAYLNKRVVAFSEKTFVIGLCLIPLFLLSTFMTIRTLRKQAINVNELTAIFNASPDGIIYVNSKGVISKANKAAIELFGYSLNEFVGLQVEDLMEPELKGKHVGFRYRFMSEEQERSSEKSSLMVRGLAKDGTSIELSIAISVKKLGEDMVSICVIKDLTHINTLQRNSDTDHLTSLSNRRHFDDVLKKELNRTLRTGREASLLLIDLDHFKTLNDEQGHLEGDIALKSAADFLVKHSRECDYVARWGGDEFAIFCPDLKESEAIKFAERLRKEFEDLVINPNCSLTLSIGIAGSDLVRPLSSKLFLEAADKAVYAAKEAGKNRVVHYKDF